MNNESLVEIKAAIYEVGLLFGTKQQPNQQMINAYAKALINYTPKQITFAFNQVILSGSAFFPSLAEVLAHLRPAQESKEDMAPRIVAEMLKLIRDFSQYDEEKMMGAASPIAREAFRQLGSTWDIRMSEDQGIVRAQLERLVKSVIAGQSSIDKEKKLAAIGIRTPDGAIDFQNLARSIAPVIEQMN